MAWWYGSTEAEGREIESLAGDRGRSRASREIESLAGDRGRSATDEPGDESRSVVPGAFVGDTNWSMRALSELRWLPALLERRVGLPLVSAPASPAAPSAVLSDRRRLLVRDPKLGLLVREPKLGRSRTASASATERGLRPAARSAFWAARTCGERRAWRRGEHLHAEARRTVGLLGGAYDHVLARNQL